METISKPYIIEVFNAYDTKWNISYFRKELKKPHHYISTTRNKQTAFGFETLAEATEFAEYAASVWTGLKFFVESRLEVK
jgi:hypothetical protein